MLSRRTLLSGQPILNDEPPHSAWAPFRSPDFRRLVVATACATLAGRGMAVVLGYQVYQLTGSTLALGMLGLVEAIPMLGLVLYGGHIADRHDRRKILLISLVMLALASATLSMVSCLPISHLQLATIFGVVFCAGIARGFAEPAVSAFEAQVVPWEHLVRASATMASCWLTGATVGPLLAGGMFATFGPVSTYGAIAALYAGAWLAVKQIASRPKPVTPPGESVFQSVAVGVRYVWSDQVLLGSMALDLFAVLFGGAIALLPVFARDILHVDAFHLGMMNAAPTFGALMTMLWCAQRPPVQHAGRTLFAAVGAFGLTMIVFALSKSFWLTIAALFLSGVFDGVSVVIRRAILRLLSPDHLRGRIAAVGTIFIGSSNELGALESGLAAAWLGTVPSVLAGGIVTLLVVATAAVMAPKLRRLSLDPSRAARHDEQVDVQLDNVPVES